VIGCSLGGWLAAEVAALCTHRIGRLVLVDPLGIKLSSHAPDGSAPDYDELSDEALLIHAHNREALCLYVWHPYMYNPQLPRWLARIDVPTLVLWG
jgi:pimeloyl-ACP methyl ester carboxylesterase